MKKHDCLLKELHGDYWYYKHIEHGRIPFWLFAMRYIGAAAWLHLRRIPCTLWGHRWEETGDIGPDSGTTYMTCKRCGVSHQHRWY